MALVLSVLGGQHDREGKYTCDWGRALGDENQLRINKRADAASVGNPAPRGSCTNCYIS
jgi:hypothetical protein